MDHGKEFQLMLFVEELLAGYRANQERAPHLAIYKPLDGRYNYYSTIIIMHSYSMCITESPMQLKDLGLK